MCDPNPFKPKPFEKQKQEYTSKERTQDLKSKTIYANMLDLATYNNDCGQNYNGTIKYDICGNIINYRNYELAMNTARGASIISKGCECKGDEYLEYYTPAGSGNSRLAGINRSLRPFYDTPNGEIGACCDPTEFSWKVAKITPKRWNSITISDDGVTIFGAATNSTLWRSFSSGVNWSSLSSNSTWAAVTSSRDGKKLAANTGAGGSLLDILYYTLDTTTTLSTATRAGYGPWNQMCSSRDNSKIYVAASYGGSGTTDSGCTFSYNSGQTWGVGGGLSTQRDFYSIGCNGDGTIVYIGLRSPQNTVNGELWRSTNSGGLFTQVGAAGLPITSSQKWYGIDLSDSGQYVYAADFSANASGGFIWMSKDFGNTFTQLTSAGQRRWWDVKCSSSGQYLIATNNANIFTSDDFGTTWKTETFPAITYGNIRAIAITSDGLRKAAADYGEIGPPFPANNPGRLFVYNNLKSFYYE
jgi:hypothetical protein